MIGWFEANNVKFISLVIVLLLRWNKDKIKIFLKNNLRSSSKFYFLLKIMIFIIFIAS